MTEQQLTPSSVWDEWTAKAKSGEAKIVKYWAGGLIIAALDSNRSPELWVEIPSLNENHRPTKTRANKTSRGLITQVEAVTVDSRACTVLSIKLGDDEFAEPFSAFADLLVEDLYSDKSLTGNKLEVETKIGKWVDFFSLSKNQVSRESVLGLIGELHFIDQWLDQKSVSYKSWTGPIGESKDFRGPNLDVEVKVSGSRSGPLVHKISSLDQLQPSESRPLFLFSLRVSLGVNNKRSLEELISRVRENAIFCRDLSAASYLAEALSKFKVLEDIPKAYSRFEILDEKFFLVHEEFPRIHKESFSSTPEITSIQYEIDLTSVQPSDEFSPINWL
jgi:hypothetical protein